MPIHNRKESYLRQEAYLNSHRELLSQLKAMWEDPMVQLYNDAELPDIQGQYSVFLAGPTTRSQVLECQWRAQAVALLRHHGFTGWIYCPEPRGLEAATDFTERSYIHRWESDRLFSPTTAASHVMFWISRKADELLGLNTNLELGMSLSRAFVDKSYRRKLFVGWPDDAERMGLPAHYMHEVGVLRYSELDSLCADLANRK